MIHVRNPTAAIASGLCETVLITRAADGTQQASAYVLLTQDTDRILPRTLLWPAQPGTKLFP